MLPPSPGNLQCRGGEAGRPDPGGASHGPVYQGKPDDGEGPEYQPLRIIHHHEGIWRDSPGVTENSSRAYSEQPGPL